MICPDCGQACELGTAVAYAERGPEFGPHYDWLVSLGESLIWDCFGCGWMRVVINLTGAPDEYTPPAR